MSVDLGDAFDSGTVDTETAATIERHRIRASAVDGFREKTKRAVQNNLFITRYGRRTRSQH